MSTLTAGEAGTEVEAGASGNNSDNSVVVECLVRLLLRVVGEQPEPLWPPLGELPVPVDRMGFDIPSLEDEHILWAN